MASSEGVAASSPSSVLMHLSSMPFPAVQEESIAIASSSSSSSSSSSNNTISGNNEAASSSSGSLSVSVPDDEDINSIRSLPTISATEDEPFCEDMLWASAGFVYEAYGLPTSEAFNNNIRYCSDFTSEVICQTYGHTEFSVYDDPIKDDSLTYANDACCMCGKLLMPLSFESLFKSSRFTLTKLWRRRWEEISAEML